MIITIDGPAASGKSTLGKLLADRLGYFYLYSGLLYRAVAYILQKQRVIENYAADKQVTHAQLLSDLNSAQQIVYSYSRKQGGRIVYNNRDITQFLSTPEISQWASILGSHALIRDMLVNLQREIAQNKNIIADGRDCGTQVFPDAEFKFFLTASLDIRAGRFMKDQEKRGLQLTHEEALAQLAQRDFRDRTRTIAPLEPAQDAIIIDNSLLTREQTLELFLQFIRL